MVNADKREEMEEKTEKWRAWPKDVHKKKVGLKRCWTDMSLVSQKNNMQSIFLMNLPLNKQWKLVETVAFILLFLYFLFWRGGGGGVSQIIPFIIHFFHLHI